MPNGVVLLREHRSLYYTSGGLMVDPDEVESRQQALCVFVTRFTNFLLD